MFGTMTLALDLHGAPMKRLGLGPLSLLAEYHAKVVEAGRDRRAARAVVCDANRQCLSLRRFRRNKIALVLLQVGDIVEHERESSAFWTREAAIRRERSREQRLRRRQFAVFRVRSCKIAKAGREVTRWRGPETAT